jgi:antitoxin YefM
MQMVAETENARLGSLLDDLAQGRQPITITRNGREAAVLISADEFASIQETLHLLSTPANTERLRQGLTDFTAGKLLSHDLCD